MRMIRNLTFLAVLGGGLLIVAETPKAFMLSYERCAQQEPFCCSGLRADATIVCEDACYPYYGAVENDWCDQYVGPDEDMCCLTFDCGCYPMI